MQQPAIDSPYFAHETACIDPGAVIGTGTAIWHFSHVMPGAVIGEHCRLGQNVFVAAHVRVGDHVKIQNNVSLYEGVTLESFAFCGPSVVFTNVRNPRSAFPRNTSDDYQRTHVGYGATLGANATIVCGARIGRWSFVAAGAVVNRDVPDYALVVGVPARQVGWVCQCGERIEFESRRTTCQTCERDYRIAGNRVELDGEHLPLGETPAGAETARNPVLD